MCLTINSRGCKQNIGVHVMIAEGLVHESHTLEMTKSGDK